MRSAPSEDTDEEDEDDADLIESKVAKVCFLLFAIVWKFFNPQHVM